MPDKEKRLDKSCQARYNKTVPAVCRDLGCVGGQSLLQERVVHRLLVYPLLFSEGGGDMQSTFEQILLLGGGAGGVSGEPAHGRAAYPIHRGRPGHGRVDHAAGGGAGGSGHLWLSSAFAASTFVAISASWNCVFCCAAMERPNCFLSFT